MRIVWLYMVYFFLEIFGITLDLHFVYVWCPLI